jgi:hypothetical protein
MSNTFAKIDISKAEKTEDVIKLINALKIKLDNTVGSLLNQHSVPNYKYLMTYMVGNSGITLSVSADDIYNECTSLAERLSSAGVKEFKDSTDVYAEFKTATLDTLIEDKMKENQLILNGSEIRYKKSAQGKRNEPWLSLTDDVKVYVNRLELTEEDIKQFHKDQMKETFEKLKKLGITVDDNGNFIIK